MPQTVGQHLARRLEALLREHLDASWTDETENLEALGEPVSESGRYWARTSDPQLVELVLTSRFTGSFLRVGKYLGKSYSGEGGFRRCRAGAPTRARCSARPARRRDAEVIADLPRELEIDLAMARHGRRPLGVEAPETVIASLT